MSAPWRAWRRRYGGESDAWCAPRAGSDNSPARDTHAGPDPVCAVLSSPAMTAQRQRLGRAAEDLVAARLLEAHWEILERNARTRYGELDLVALDGRTLVFVEVKASRVDSAFGPERPVHSIDWRKQRRVRRLATAWLGERRS